MIQRAKQVLWIGMVWIGIGASFDLSAGPRPERVYRKVLPGVMMLEVENFAGERFVGSAVLGLADDIAITAWHVVSDARSVRAVFADGVKMKVQGCVNVDEERDLALLKLERALPGRKPVMAYARQAIATRVYVIGAPKGYSFSISDGLLSQIREINGVAQYQISCPISPGNSGGPLLNERGEVIGITSWTKSDASNLSFAIPTADIQHLDTRGPVVSWETLALKARSPEPSRVVSMKAAAKDDGRSTPGFDDFARRLERSTGKRVTVVVREDGKESTYLFTVPDRIFK